MKPMNSLQETIIRQQQVISETEQYFKIQDRYFAEQNDHNLQLLRVQAQKVKKMLNELKLKSKPR